MIVKILGVIDIISAIILFLTAFTKFSSAVLLLFAFYLIAKGIFFAVLGGFALSSFSSFIDIGIGVVFYLSSNFAIPKVLVSLLSLFLLQKGVFSLF